MLPVAVTSPHPKSRVQKNKRKKVYYYDVYQYFIIGSGDAERLKEYTNELVYYCEDLDLYILGVCHFGTPWNGVSANWKDEIEEY